MNWCTRREFVPYNVGDHRRHGQAPQRGWLGVAQRTVVGALLATHLQRIKKVALHIQPEKIAGVVDAEARRLGLGLRIFPTAEEALRWAMS